MTEHGWPDDHHDDGGSFDHHDHDHAGDAPEPVDLDPALPDEDVWDAPHELHHEPDVHYEPDPEPAPAAEEPFVADADDDAHEMATVGADPDALPDTADDHAGVFPAVVDVGPLPEPVDGFPWIDTGSLGLVDPATVHAAATPDPAELAEYAAADLPPGVDPWAELAGSDDPATSALARFWGSAARPDQP